jgi:uncharacterized protein YbjQ (UPF0145 family)
MIVATTNEVAGHRVTRHLGVVRGITEVLAYGTALVVERE